MFCTTCGAKRMGDGTSSVELAPPIPGQTTRSSFNGLVVAVACVALGIGLFVVIGNKVRIANSTLSGIYTDDSGLAKIEFKANQFTLTLGEQSPDSGTYTLKENEITLDPTSGVAAQDTAVAQSPIYKTLTSFFVGRVSSDHKVVEVAGLRFIKQD
jgi:hypothetical protein